MKQTIHIFYQFYKDVYSLFNTRFKLFALLSPVFLALTLLCYALLGVVIASTGCSKTRDIPNSELQIKLAEELLRFHVIANSDSTEDQEVKLKVKEQLISYLQPHLSNSNSKAEVMDILDDQLNSITTVANEVLQENGFTYEAKASLSSSTFPVKVYGDITLPPGEYDALRVELGKAEGQNWWCIMFPSLCFVDGTYGFVPEESKEQLKYVLTEDEYDSITSKKVDVTVKFKVLEWIKSIF